MRTILTDVISSPSIRCLSWAGRLWGVGLSAGLVVLVVDFAYIIRVGYNVEFVEAMDNLKIEGIFPISISEISCANEESEFGGFSITHHRPNEKVSDYHIKINAPDCKQHEHPLEKQPRFQKQQVVGQGQGQSQQPVMPPQPVPQTQHSGKQTGYHLNKDSFSEEQILKAFNIIDINKDNTITEDDLIFVLEYIKEDFTLEEVREMIGMLAADGRAVGFEEFKKLGRGDIVPLAKYHIAGDHHAHKGAILDNIAKCDLGAEDPSFLVECLKKQSISFTKYQEQKKGSKSSTHLKPEAPSKDKLLSAIPILSPLDLQTRQKLFRSVVVCPIQDIIENYNSLEPKDKPVSLQKIATLLEISVKEAKELYPKEAEPLLVIMEAVVYSMERLERKLELGLDLSNGRAVVTVAELVHVLQVVKGRDQAIDKKIRAILQAKSIREPLSKSLAFEIVLEYMSKLIGIN